MYQHEIATYRSPLDAIRRRPRAAGLDRNDTAAAIAAFHRCKSTRERHASKDYEVAEGRGGQESKRETLRADEGQARNALSQFSFFLPTRPTVIPRRNIHGQLEELRQTRRLSFKTTDRLVERGNERLIIHRALLTSFK